jgi:hypothetical protein
MAELFGSFSEPVLRTTPVSVRIKSDAKKFRPNQTWSLDPPVKNILTYDALGSATAVERPRTPITSLTTKRRKSTKRWVFFLSSVVLFTLLFGIRWSPYRKSSKSSSPVIEPSTAQKASSSLPLPRPLPVDKKTDSQPPIKDTVSSNSVTITIRSSAKEAEVFLGKTRIGAVGEPIQIDRGEEKVTLMVKAPRLQPAFVQLVPNQNLNLDVLLKPLKVKTDSNSKRKAARSKVNRDLENPF